MIIDFYKNLKVFTDLLADLGISKYKICKLIDKYSIEYMQKTISYCMEEERLKILEKTPESLTENIKKYIILSIENNILNFSVEQINEFKKKQADSKKKTDKKLKSNKTSKAKPKLKPKEKAKTLTEHESKVLNAPMKTYGLDSDQRGYLFKIAKFVGMNEFILYRFAEQHGFDYIYATILYCNDREKLAVGPAYLIAAIKNDYWNLKDQSYNDENMHKSAIEHREIFDNATPPALMN